MRLFNRKQKNTPPQERVRLFLRDRQQRYPRLYEGEDGLRLVGSYSVEELELATLKLEGLLTEQYGIGWFYNAYTDCYHTFGDHLIVGRLERIRCG